MPKIDESRPFIPVRIAVLTIFVAWELRNSSPMIDVRLFKDRRFRRYP